ncbi:phosphatase PAP2/dual specificity phosphatase family protein [Aquitalea sp. LB_tupeE]|uniref:phosphatase PAP2/dual specificity phosphatase family protein n=1 Tax=Aquitalea sp. LB_tupeE TaxID=2748078 RepID=UPI0015BE8A8A|nr:phosphatase PAP2/dual specificity phosphatase family protein [Aquitalea sp. LB_tupeE]NWK79238.1 phosphatase PAP2/dual specificity phosphatase family protein [Aquitalea sp. LB_tupeE]
MSQPAHRRLWPEALLWLALLGPAFFLLYGAANHYAASLPPSAVGNIAMDWERRIPLWPWTILPYWSIDLLYGLSLFICTSREELRRHALRLLSVTVLSCLLFALFPLRFGFERPPLDGWAGQLFTLLAGFDKPFNQAPSLHISLLTVLWLRYAVHTPQRWRWLLHGWFTLIGISVLTTWQHHFLDIPTGFALGIAVCYLLPMPLPPYSRVADIEQTHRRQLSRRYALGGLALTLAAIWLGGWYWLLLWPALSLIVLAVGYGCHDARVWQKVAGRHRLPARCLFLPLTLFMRQIHTRLLRGHSHASLITDDVWIGPAIAARETCFRSVLDLAAEYCRQAHPAAHYVDLPLLDLVLPDRAGMHHAVAQLETLRHSHPGPVLVHCALGMSRSAAVIMVWLVMTGRCSDLAQAKEILQARGRKIVLSPQQWRWIDSCCTVGAGHDA